MSVNNLLNWSLIHCNLIIPSSINHYIHNKQNLIGRLGLFGNQSKKTIESFWILSFYSKLLLLLLVLLYDNQWDEEGRWVLDGGMIVFLLSTTSIRGTKIYSSRALNWLWISSLRAFMWAATFSSPVAGSFIINKEVDRITMISKNTLGEMDRGVEG